MKGFQAVNKFVIVEHVDHQKLSKGGLYVDTSSKNPGVPITSKVVSCSADNDQGLNDGDRILFYRHAAEDIYIADKKYLIVSGKAVIGVYLKDE